MGSFKTSDIWLATWLSLRGVVYSHYDVVPGKTKITFTYSVPEPKWKELRQEFASNIFLNTFRRELQSLKDLGYQGAVK